MIGISLDQRGHDVGVALLRCLMQGRVILLGGHVDLGVVLQQEAYHRQIAEVRRHVDRPVARLRLALHVRAVLHEDRGDADEVFLGAQVQRCQSILWSYK